MALLAAWISNPPPAAFLSSLLSRSIDDPLSTPVRLEPDGPDIVAPLLRSTQLPLRAEGKCKEKRNEVVTLGLIINKRGLPLDIMFIHPLGNDIDRAALLAVEGDRFTAATKNGEPVAVSRAIDVEVEACRERYKDTEGRKMERVWIAAQPQQRLRPIAEDSKAAAFFLRSEFFDRVSVLLSGPAKIGKGVSAPVPLVFPEAVFTEKARKAKINGMVLVTLLVDPHGIPQQARVIRKLDPGLDQSALDAANKYRFTPALANGAEPVPVMITVEVNFRLY